MVKKKLYTLIVNLDQNELGHFDTTNKDKQKSLLALAQILPTLPPNEFQLIGLNFDSKH